MNLSNIHSCFLHAQNSISSLILRCGPSCSHRSQVHPEICNPEDLEFVHLGAQRVIRIVHLSQKPIDHFIQPLIPDNRKELKSQNEKISSNFDVSTEEYWFTRSIRPFRIDNSCECISNTYAISRQLAGTSWRHMAEGCSEVMKSSSDDFHFRIFSRERIVNGIETFADAFVKVVLNEVFFHVAGKRMPCHDSLDCKNYVLNSEHMRDNVNSSSLAETHNLLNLNGCPNKEIRAEVHHSDNEKLEDITLTKERECNSKNEATFESYLTYSDGIVNHSFEGTMSEPDALPCSVFDDAKVVEELLVSTEILECQLENLNVVKETLKQSDCIVNKEIDLNECEYQMSEVEITNASVPKGESLYPFKVKKHQDECSVRTENIRVSLNSCLDDPIDKKVNIDSKFNADCCKHTKNTQKPLLLFLHGAGSSADVWSVILEYFASAGYEVLAPDMLGHGYSSAPDNRAAYTFDRLLQDILQIFDRFVADHQKCIVIGHSYGSCFAAALARYRPQQVVQLVLLSSGGPSPLVPKQAFFSFPSCVMSFMKPFLMCGFKRDLFYAPRGKHLPPCCTYEMPPYVLKHMECGQEWSDGDSAFHRRIFMPTLLVHGLKDPYITLVEECEMERTIPRSFLEVISNAGHMLMLDTPEQLCHMIHSFITWWNS